MQRFAGLARTISTGALASLALGVWSFANAAYWDVLPDGSGDCPTIAEAVQAASAGDVIVLGDGTFTGPGNQGVTVAKDLSIRSMSLNPATCILDLEGGPYPAFSFVSVGPAMRLSGVTIKRGEGGAVRCSTASPTIRECILRDNRADDGGAVYCTQFSSPILDGCWIMNNAAVTPGEGKGGGVYCEAGSSPTFLRTQFVRNRANQGGGLYCVGAALALSNCDFIENIGNEGGGGVYALGSELTIRANVFFQNTGTGTGSALHVGSTGSPFEVLLYRCLLTGNTGGEAVAVTGAGSMNIEGTTITGSSWGLVGSKGAHVSITTSIVWPDGMTYKSAGGEGEVGCSDVNWSAVEGFVDLGGNLSIDPAFCGPSAGDDYLYYLQPSSPCAPQNNSCGVLMGALAVRCEPVSVASESWGRLKARYR